MKALFSLYSRRYPAALVYMLQNTEYRAAPYLAWYWQTQNFSRIMYRRELHRTKAARLLLLALKVGIATEIILGLLLVGLWWRGDMAGGLAFGLALILGYPIVWAHLIVVPLVLGRWIVVWPRQAGEVRDSIRIFANFKGPKIAIAGSYGKTSMKELLVAVLGESRRVAATPANKNVAISHARFARKLTGKEEILLIEYGEAAPGDVARFTRVTQPTHAVITGLAAAHLDAYKTIQNAGRDIFSVAEALPAEHVWVNGESAASKPFMRPGYKQYDHSGVSGWKIRDVQLGFDGTRFTMLRGKERLELHTRLLGRHHLGPLAAAVALAVEFGLSLAEVKAGVAKTAPFEHRMQPYQLQGAWIIDDTYNGNLEGIRAGTALLKELPAKRKIYITPGLVDQGRETATIHREMGTLIAGAKPDVVVLMRHSVTPYIQEGLERAGYQGEVLIESDPLDFYQNLQVFVAAGDVVLMQNDWPDNYR